MPLSVYKRDADGEIIKDGQNEGVRELLPLKGEIAEEDSRPDDINFVSIEDCFNHASLKGNFWCFMPSLASSKSKDFDDYKIELAEFLNKSMSGPYYIGQGDESSMVCIDVCLLVPEDIETFATQYPESEWVSIDDAETKNAKTLAKWKDLEIPLTDESLFNYAQQPQ